MMKIASLKQMIINEENFKKFFNEYSTKSEMYTGMHSILFDETIDISEKMDKAGKFFYEQSKYHFL